jgi:isochorismate hydrolase
MTTTVKRDPKTDHLLTPENAALLLIDYQPAMVDGTKSVDREVLVNNVVALTKAAKMFDLPIDIVDDRGKRRLSRRHDRRASRRDT